MTNPLEAAETESLELLARIEEIQRLLGQRDVLDPETGSRMTPDRYRSWRAELDAERIEKLQTRRRLEATLKVARRGAVAVGIGELVVLLARSRDLLTALADAGSYLEDAPAAQALAREIEEVIR